MIAWWYLHFFRRCSCFFTFDQTKENTNKSRQRRQRKEDINFQWLSRFGVDFFFGKSSEKLPFPFDCLRCTAMRSVISKFMDVKWIHNSIRFISGKKISSKQFPSCNQCGDESNRYQISLFNFSCIWPNIECQSQFKFFSSFASFLLFLS